MRNGKGGGTISLLISICYSIFSGLLDVWPDTEATLNIMMLEGKIMILFGHHDLK